MSAFQRKFTNRKTHALPPPEELVLIRQRTLIQQLRSAERVEATRPWEDPFEDYDDGAWECCNPSCGHQNPLVHYHGDYPFCFLRCASCHHVMCRNCPSSEILTHIIPLEGSSVTVSSCQGEVPYIEVCSTCGLTHRPAMKGLGLRKAFRNTRVHFKTTVCEGCGALPNDGWARFKIGSNSDWRYSIPPLGTEEAYPQLYDEPPNVPAYRRLAQHGEETLDITIPLCDPEDDATIASVASSLRRRGAIRRRNRPPPHVWTGLVIA